MLSDGEVHATGVPVNPDLFLTERYTTLRSQQMFLGTPNYWNLRQDPGFFAVEKNTRYFGTFLTPSLREVSKTAPYMHNGILPTLASVVDFYDKGGEQAKNKDPRIKPLGLTAAEKAALVEFLKSLSGDDLGIKTASFAEEKMPKYQLKKWVGEGN
jgi:cytochrome c peroxidase